MTGALMVWFEARSYGFIRPDTSTVEVFVHRSDFIGAVPPKGTKVSFDVVEYCGRSKAVNVTPIVGTPVGVKS